MKATETSFASKATTTGVQIPSWPAAPTNAGTVTNQTQNTIMIGSENGQEYRCGTGGTWGDWQTDSDGLITFENLSPGTEYTIQNRYQSGKDENGQEHFASFTNSTTSVTLPSITTTSLETGYVGVAYSDQLEAVVAEGTNVTWSLENSSLPAGLTLNGDGTISGTPTTAGQFSVIVKVAIFGELGQERAGTMGQLSITIRAGTLTGTLTITGNPVAGQTLTASYSDPGVALSYQWYRGGTAISGATGDTYTLTAQDVGQSITVTATAADNNYDGSVTSDPVTVGKATGSIEISCGDVTYGTAVNPIVTSTTNEGADVTYTYTGTDGTEYGPSETAPTDAGTYTVTATVAETATHTAATSEPVTFTIEGPPVPPRQPQLPG